MTEQVCTVRISWRDRTRGVMASRARGATRACMPLIYTTLPSTSQQDAHRVSSALPAITGSVKLDYEIHGNTLRHLHMHFFPRYAGDPFEGVPSSRFVSLSQSMATGSSQGSSLG
jgi:hypothetical protein